MLSVIKRVTLFSEVSDLGRQDPGCRRCLLAVAALQNCDPAMISWRMGKEWVILDQKLIVKVESLLLRLETDSSTRASFGSSS
jgi:hypothetical protein